MISNEDDLKELLKPYEKKIQYTLTLHIASVIIINSTALKLYERLFFMLDTLKRLIEQTDNFLWGWFMIIFLL